MTFIEKLRNRWRQADSLVCVGLDPDPAKFPDAMAEICGTRPALPQRLTGLMTAPERFDVLDNDASAVEAYVAARARIVREG